MAVRVKEQKTKWFRRLKTPLLVVFGNALITFAIAAFVLPNGLITGGVTGIGLVLQHWTGWDVELGVAAANLLLYFWGALVLGKRFALHTALSTLLFPTFLSLFGRLEALRSLTDDTLLAALYAGLLIGGGLGLVLREGASTGGMDIPPLVLNRKFGFSVPFLIYAFDTAILLLQVPFSTPEQVLYGIAVAILTSLVMDKAMLLGKSQTQALIVSPRCEEINQAIQKDLDRGSTLLRSVTGHLRRERLVVLTVVAQRQLAELNRLVLELDPAAFIVISEVNEVKGRGFSLGKHWKDPRASGGSAPKPPAAF